MTVPMASAGSDALRAREFRDLVVEEIDRPAGNRALS